MSAPKVFLASLILSTVVVFSANLSNYNRQSNDQEPPGRGGRIELGSQSRNS